MEEGTGETQLPGQGRVVPVRPISQHGMADGLQMGPDLMGPPRLEADLEQGRVLPETLAHPEPGHGPTSARQDGHTRPVPGVAPDRGVDLPPVHLRGPGHAGQVFANDPPPFQGPGQGLVGLVGLGHDQEAGDVPVEAMDDAGPVRPRTVGQGSPGRDEGVGQGPLVEPRRPVDDEPGGLLHDEQDVVLVADRGDGRRRRSLDRRRCADHELPGAHLVGLGLGPSLHGHGPGADEVGRARSREPRPACHENVQAVACVRLSHLDPERAHRPQYRAPGAPRPAP